MNCRQATPFTTISHVYVNGSVATTAAAAMAIDKFGPHRVRLFSVDTGQNDDHRAAYVHYYLPDALQVPVETARLDFTVPLLEATHLVDLACQKAGVPDKLRLNLIDLMSPTNLPYVDLALTSEIPSSFPTFTVSDIPHTIEKLIAACLNASAFQAALEGVTVEIWDAETQYFADQPPRLPMSNGTDREARFQTVGDTGWVAWKWLNPLQGWSSGDQAEYLARQGIRTLPSIRYRQSQVELAGEMQLLARNAALELALRSSPLAALSLQPIEAHLLAAIVDHAGIAPDPEGCGFNSRQLQGDQQ